MNTSAEAVRLLQDAITNARSARAVMNDLITAHDYQDVAELITMSAAALLEAATFLMQNDDESAFTALDSAEDALDSAYAIIEGDMDDGEED